LQKYTFSGTYGNRIKQHLHPFEIFAYIRIFVERGLIKLKNDNNRQIFNALFTTRIENISGRCTQRLYNQIFELSNLQMPQAFKRRQPFKLETFN